MNISAVNLKLGLMGREWVGIDLDGTLAHCDEHQSVFDPIGEPIEKIMSMVKLLINSGVRVKILTGRASIPELIPPIEEWLNKNGIGGLEITNKKDMAMVQFWDDRCIQVLKNDGTPIQNLLGLNNV